MTRLDQLREEQNNRLRYIRIQIKDCEGQIDYLNRCFIHLDDKPTLTQTEQKSYRSVHNKRQRLNKVLIDLWAEEKMIVDMQKAHAEGRSIIPIVEGPAPNEE